MTTRREPNSVAQTLTGGQCPKCGKNRFTGPAKVTPSDEITCTECRNTCLVEEAMEAGRKAGPRK